MPASRSFESAQHGELIRFVGDAESFLEPDLIRELPQQLSAERVDRPALDLFGAFRPEPILEPVRYFTGRLVREGEGADTGRVNAEGIDKMADALDEGEGLPRPGAGKDKKWPGAGLYRTSLRIGWCRQACNLHVPCDSDATRSY